MDPSRITPNLVAWLVLLGWPVVVIAFYASRRQASLARTTAWMVMLPEMFLPSNMVFKVPSVPPLDKNRIAVIAVALALELWHPRPFSQRLREHRFPRLVFLWLAVGVVMTVRTNGDALTFGPTTLPGLTGHDALSILLGLFLDIYLPFAIGQRVLQSGRDLKDLFSVLVLCGVIYAPLFLLELRVSPQLHRWVYGYHPHEFEQHVRAGGFRPMVFMPHGLGVSMFLFSCLNAALVLHRARVRHRPSPGQSAAGAAVLVVLSKSLAATLYSGATLFAQLFLGTKTQARIVALVGLLVIGYPTIRMANLLPTEDVVGMFASLSGERASSLLFRFDQEKRLLDRAQERPVYGWGSWGRNQVYAPWGQMVSVADGYWIIVLGMLGYVGFFGVFALLVVPLLRYARSRARMPSSSQVLLGGLAIILSVYAADNLPNNALFYIPLFWAGGVFSLSDRLQHSNERPVASRHSKGRKWGDAVPEAINAPNT